MSFNQNESELGNQQMACEAKDEEQITVSEFVHKIKQFVIDEDCVWMLILKAKVERTVWKFYSYRRRGRPL